jgi:DNA-binding MarR family transcriptional regulator
MNSIKIEDRDYALWLLLTRTHYSIKQARASEVRQFKLTPEQCGALFYIHSKGGDATQSQISSWMLRKPQTISANIEGMVKKGLIKKKKDLKRRNVIHLSLTDKGQEAFEASMERKSIKKIISVLTEKKRKLLIEVLNELLEASTP